MHPCSEAPPSMVMGWREGGLDPSTSFSPPVSHDYLEKMENACAPQLMYYEN